MRKPHQIRGFRGQLHEFTRNASVQFAQIREIRVTRLLSVFIYIHPLLLAGLLASVSGAPDAQGGNVPSNGAAPLLRIELGDAALAELRLHPRAYLEGRVIEAGTGGEFGESGRQNAYRGVGIHLKGQYGTFQSTEGKPSITLNFDRFAPGQKFYEWDKLHLNNSVSDPTYMTELLCRELFAAAGVPVGRASHARVELNGRDLGLYVMVEGYNKRFLKQFFTDARGHLYDSEFMHDISYPLKSSAASGPRDRSDLQRLVEACDGKLGADLPPSDLGTSSGTGRVDRGNKRLAELGRLVDLDRFYAFLAVEIMACHFDGYARGINNYWLYHDPQSNRFTFIPHGMDQMFYNPQGSLFPELKGVVARAVLETAEGRKRFRERCTVLFTNFFPQLSNRVEEVRARLRPEVATMGTNAVAQHDRAVAELQRRIGARVAHLRRHLFAPAPGMIRLEAGQELPVTNWLSSVEQGNARLTVQRTNESPPRDLPLLLTRLEPAEKEAIGTWEARLLLPHGVYRFSAKVSCDQKIFRGPNCPVSIKIWGGQEHQFESTRTDSQHLQIAQDFSIEAEEPEEILIQCQTQGQGMNLELQLSDLVLNRLR